jgi:putative polyhydroxyalkanoate system protein
MADIRITQAHELTQEEAKAAAQTMAEQMALKYDMVSEWDGDMLVFTRSGVSGKLVLQDHAAHLEISLGFLLKAFIGAIEEKVAAKMEKVFGATS